MQLQHKSLSLDHVCWAAAIGAYLATRSRRRVGVIQRSEMMLNPPICHPDCGCCGILGEWVMLAYG